MTTIEGVINGIPIRVCSESLDGANLLYLAEGKKASAPPTRGQQLAEELIAPIGLAFSHRYGDKPCGCLMGHLENQANALPHIRRGFAEAIDKAIAEEREACAKAVEERTVESTDVSFSNGYHAGTSMAAVVIRNRK